MKQEKIAKKNVLGIFAGIIIFATMILIGPPENMSQAAWVAAATGLLMATWWISEAVAIEVTSLMPLVLFPLFGVASMKAAAAPYANPIIFLFLGGFILAKGMEKCNLHRRLALTILKFAGVKPSALIAGFMVATAFLSMWVSNTATATMMLPIALSVITMLNEGKSKEEIEKGNFFGTALLLSIAYSASIGGVATLIGTPPNALLAGYIQNTYGHTIGFDQWLIVGLPISIILLVFAWFSLTKISFPVKDVNIDGATKIVEKEIKELGAMSKAEKIVALIFSLAAIMWISRSHINSWLKAEDINLVLHDAGIAITAAVLLFLIPSDYKKGEFVLDWPSTKNISWGVLILFGGGLSLGSAITTTGLSKNIAEYMSVLNNLPPIGIIAVFAIVVTLISHMTSNTATAAAFLPLTTSVAIGLGQNPLLFAVPTVIAASCVFMMPVATPPNAIVFASGMIRVPQMVKAGLYINIVSMILLLIASYCLLGMAFGLEMNVIPEWAIEGIWENWTGA